MDDGMGKDEVARGRCEADIRRGIVSSPPMTHLLLLARIFLDYVVEQVLVVRKYRRK